MVNAPAGRDAAGRALGWERILHCCLKFRLPRASMPNPNILIADDDVAAAAMLARRLSGLGYGAAITSSKGAAVPGQPTPDLVLLSAHLRGELTAGAVDALRQHWKLPIVLVIEASEEERLRQAGGTDPCARVVEPFTDRELHANVELALCMHNIASGVRELENRFFDISIDMLCFLDFNGYFKRLNPAWERTLGFTRKELMSRPFIEFVHPDDRERTLMQNAHVRGGSDALAFENRYRCKDGSYRWLRWNAAPDSAHRTIYSVARDVTASKQAEEEREQLVRTLQAALDEVQTLRDILHICSYCRRIRDDENHWGTVESYISKHTRSQFSHDICPTCMVNVVEPQLREFKGG